MNNKITSEIVGKAKELLEQGLSVNKTAQLLNIDRKALSKHCPESLRAIQRHTTESLSDLVTSLSKGNHKVVSGWEYDKKDYRHGEVWLYCKKHQEPFKVKIRSITNTKSRDYYGCPHCKNENEAYVEKRKATQRKASNAARKASRSYPEKFIGVVTPEGHVLTEFVEYHVSPSTQKSRGARGHMKFRFTCGFCGGTGVAMKQHLLSDKKVVCCGCTTTGKRESIASHLKHPDKGMKPCRLYIADVHYGDYLKIGISNNYERRSAQGNRDNPFYDPSHTPEEHYKADGIDLSYEHCWYLSPEFPRAWVFAVEQILLKATRDYEPVEPLPKLMVQLLWCGQTELRDWKLEPRAVQAAFIKLIMEIQRNDGDWYAVYQKHINTYKIK